MKKRGLCPFPLPYCLLILVLMASFVRSFRINLRRSSLALTRWTYEESFQRIPTRYHCTSRNKEYLGNSTDSSRLEDIVYAFLNSQCQLRPGNSLVGPLHCMPWTYFFNFHINCKSFTSILHYLFIFLSTSLQLLCVSGGVDSMALLHIIAKIRNRWSPSLELAVIHFNHMLRQEAGEEVINRIYYDSSRNFISTAIVFQICHRRLL